MAVTVAEIAKALGAEFAGQGDMVVARASEPAAAGPRDLALAMDKSYAEALSKGQARAAVLWSGADWQAMGLAAAIFVTRPRFAMAGITAKFARQPEITLGIHPFAHIDPTAKIAKNAAIGPFVTIGARVKIGVNARILSHASIAESTIIGADALIYSGVRIGSGVVIGDRFIAHYNAVIGSDGFSFVTPEPSAAEEARTSFSVSQNNQNRQKSPPQIYHRIASTASVRIGDDVEIGASATIDKGTVADTIIGQGCKIDNHVQVGHNVRLGRDCLLCAHAAIAGSTILGDRVVLGGQAGVGDHLVLGDDVIAAGATAILSNVPKGRVMMGYPAMKMKQNIDAYKALRRLPRLVARVQKLEKQVSNPNKNP